MKQTVKERPSCGKLWWFIACLTAAPAAPADIYLGIGSGVVHTTGVALQLGAPVAGGVEVHYSVWDDGDSDQAAGIGYRFSNGSPISVVLGVAYIGRLTENLLHQADVYIEIRVHTYERFFCQLAHYSSIGDDKGENFLLCGVRWGWRDG